MTALALGIPLAAITLLGLLLNLYIILVVILSKQVHTANNLLLLHLGVVDVCVGGVLGAVLLSGDALGRGLGLGADLDALADLAGAGPCSLTGFLLSLLHPVALWTLCGLHTDRYFAISTPLHYGAKVSTRKVLWGLAACWVASLLLALLALLPGCGEAAAAGSAPAPRAVAVDSLRDEPPWAAPWTAPWPLPAVPWAPWGPALYVGIYTALTLLLPATIVLVCNLKVLMIARHHRHRIASAIFEVTLSAQVTITHQRNPFTGALAVGGSPPGGSSPSPPLGPGAAAAVAAAAAAKFRNRSALCPVLQLLGSLVLLYFPYYALLVWDALAASEAVPGPPRSLATLAVCLAACSPPVNGLLYGVKNKVLRKTIQNYWRKQMSKSEVNQEIQARTPSTCGSRRPSLTPLGAQGAQSQGAAGMVGPTGGHGSSTLQRRLSEIVLEPLRSSVSVGSAFGSAFGSAVGSASPRGTKFHKVASDLVWRPRHWLLGRSLNSIEQHALSWHQSSNTLQIPSVTSNGDLSSGSLGLSAGGHGHGHGHGHGTHPLLGVAARGGSAASLPAGPAGTVPGHGGHGSLFVQRVLHKAHGHGPARPPRHSPSLLLASVSRRSPRILITRAFSEESDGQEPGEPAPIQHSTSASALVSDGHHHHHLNRRWRRIRYRDQDEDVADPLGLVGPLSDDSSSPSEHAEHAERTDGDPDGDAADAEERALLSSPVASSACSPVSSPEPLELGD